MLLAALGSFVPDVLWGLETVVGHRLFGPHYQFHKRNHNFFHVKIPFVAGLILQFVATVGMWWYALAH